MDDAEVSERIGRAMTRLLAARAQISEAEAILGAMVDDLIDDRAARPLDDDDPDDWYKRGRYQHDLPE